MGPSAPEQPHAVCIPYPAQGHINPMFKLAKLLHFKGFFVTFVNTEYNHRRLLKSRGPESLNGLPSFQFKTIPDGLPPAETDATQHIPSLCDSTSKSCLAPLKELLSRLNDTASSNCPPVTCIVSDGTMSFTLDAAQELEIPDVLFWTTSACGFLCYCHFRQLIEKNYIQFNGSSCLTNAYMETVIDWIPGFKDIRLKDFPSFLRTTDPDDVFLVNSGMREVERARKASAVILNTFDVLEHETISALRAQLPPVYSIGPLHLLQNHVTNNDLKSLGSNLWKEEPECLDWLNSKEPNSVVYVNFGSITVMTNHQLKEFAWGLTNSNKTFFWVIRPDLVSGENAGLPPEFTTAIKERGLLASWCPQEEVLRHPSVGGFLTHSGWNSTLESITAGVPMICWPFFAEQQTNCRFSCVEWGVGMEINSDVNRNEVESLVRELMEGIKGKKMRDKAMEWKKLAEESCDNKGSSYKNLDDVINKVLLPQKY